MEKHLTVLGAAVRSGAAVLLASAAFFMFWGLIAYGVYIIAMALGFRPRPKSAVTVLVGGGWAGPGRYSLSAAQNSEPEITSNVTLQRPVRREISRTQISQPRHGRGRHEDECDFIRWCFADPNIAAAFAAAFGGTVQSTTALRGARQSPKLGISRNASSRCSSL